MKKQDFLNDYYCQFSAINDINNIELIIETKVIRRIDNYVTQIARETYNIYETTQLINDSQLPLAFNTLDWEIIKDKVKRLHLSLVAYIFKLDNYFPTDENIDIEDMYR